MNFEERVKYIISAIRVQSPSLDTSPASPIRVLIDAVAELGTQADIAIDRAYNWDISDKSGRDLDNFVENFGFTRLPAQHATGFVTLTFSYNTTTDHLIPEGTRLWSVRRDTGTSYSYLTRETVGIPRFTAFTTIPVVAEFPGALYNAQPGEINRLDYNIEQLVKIVNDDSISGGKSSESDVELRDRFRAELFRNNLGNESWYRSIALRHPSVSSVQLITPSQEIEEHLQIKNAKVECQEDSLVFTYPDTFNVYLPRTDDFLEEDRDFIVIIDNTSPLPPVIEFLGNKYQEGDSVTVKYRYCSSRSRNNPLMNNVHYLDMYVTGNNSASVIDLSTWSADQVFGSGLVNESTHPDGIMGLPYYIFTRQPVVKLPSEIIVQGRSYLINRDYVLVKDKTVNADSTRAKDIIMWKTNLPSGDPIPTFHINYFHEAVISDIQEVIDEPDMHTAVDDILVHAATQVEFDIDLVIEWERGISDVDALREVIENHFTTIAMGSKIRIGPLTREITQLPRVAAVFFGNDGISSPTSIRGRNKWKYDVPLIDGSVPVLRNLNITTTASNIYN